MGRQGAGGGPKTSYHYWMLSTAEWNVVKALCAGDGTIEDVARRLIIAPTTVRYHLMVCREKMHVVSNVGIVLAVIDHDEARQECFPALAAAAGPESPATGRRLHECGNTRASPRAG